MYYVKIFFQIVKKSHWLFCRHLSFYFLFFIFWVWIIIFFFLFFVVGFLFLGRIFVVGLNRHLIVVFGSELPPNCWNVKWVFPLGLTILRFRQKFGLVLVMHGTLRFQCQCTEPIHALCLYYFWSTMFWLSSFLSENWFFFFLWKVLIGC